MGKLYFLDEEEKSRVLKGAKEAKWNSKYMKIIEKPVEQI
jgi:hypothetical protein